MKTDREFTENENIFFSALGDIQDFLEGLCEHSLKVVDELTSLQAEYFNTAEEMVIQQIADLLECERNKIPVELVENALKAIQDLGHD